jgi:hypothetical protein
LFAEATMRIRALLLGAGDADLVDVDRECFLGPGGAVLGETKTIANLHKHQK